MISWWWKRKTAGCVGSCAVQSSTTSPNIRDGHNTVVDILHIVQSKPNTCSMWQKITQLNQLLLQMCDTYTITIHLKVDEMFVLHTTLWARASLRVVSWKANALLIVWWSNILIRCRKEPRYKAYITNDSSTNFWKGVYGQLQVQTMNTLQHVMGTRLYTLLLQHA